MWCDATGTCIVWRYIGDGITVTAMKIELLNWVGVLTEATNVNLKLIFFGKE